MTTRQRREWLILPSLFFLSGCGWATGGVLGLSSGSGSGGSSNSPATLTDVVIEARTSPAVIRFTLTDSESNPIDLRLQYEDPNTGNAIGLILVENPEQEIDANLVGLASSPAGVLHEKRWDFARSDQIGTSRLTRDIRVSLQGSEGATDLEPRVLRIDTGNDPPSLTLTSRPGRSVTGFVSAEFTVFDSQDDPVTVTAFYDLLDDDPDQGFRPARGGTASGEDGQPFEFLWNAPGDLGFNDHDVELRLVPNDGLASGPGVIDRLRVDNNTEPRVEINDSALLVSSDRRGGIPIPFVLFDGNLETGEPGDESTVVFQWRTDNQPAFPELPALRDAAEARSFLVDPALADLRRQLQVCTEIRRTFEGRILPVDSTRVRLPELAADAAGALERDLKTGDFRIVGTLEILRASSIPEPVKESWPTDPGLVAPVAALPVGSGPRSIVLEDLDGAWRIRLLDTATGRVIRLLAGGDGAPTVFTYERGERSLLLALAREIDGGWELRRVDLAATGGGPGQLLASSSDGNVEAGAIRGLVSLGSETALLTAGRSLVRVSYPPGEPPILFPVLGPPDGPLVEPWGLALDARFPDRVLVADRGADRIVSVNLDRRGPVTEVAARGPGVPRPTALALVRSRLLVLTDADPDDGTRELRSLELGSPVDLDEDGRADLPVHEIRDGLDANHVSAGSDRFLILPLTASSDLAVGGGVTHRLTLGPDESTYDPASQTVGFVRPLLPLPRRGDRWRLARTIPTAGTPEGTDGTFVWSSDDASQGNIRLRGTAFDGDRGPGGRPSISITVRSALDTEPVIVPTDRTGVVQILPADLDEDGDLDLLATAFSPSPGLVLLFQTSPGRFAEPVFLEHPELAAPSAIATGDLDGDGDTDIVSANNSVDIRNLALFFQTTPGVFDPEPTVLQIPGGTGTGRLVAADVEGDGDLDLVVTLPSDNAVAVYLQISPGVFDDDAPILVDLAPDFPVAVVVADLDTDGDLDLATAGNGASGTPFLTIFPQTSPGVFDTGQRTELTFPRVIAGINDLIAADLDQDGDTDLAAAGFDPPPENRSSLSVFFQTSPGVFDGEPTVLRDPSFDINRPVSLQAADVDGDRDLDLVTLDDIANKFTVHVQATPGIFDPVPVSIEFEADLVLRLAAVDLDGNGATDLVTTLVSGEVAILFPAVPGTFETDPVFLTDPRVGGPTSVVAADLDQDGDFDLASSNSGSNNLAVFPQTSAGIFESPLVLRDPSLVNPASLRSADLDQDGDLDLLAASNPSDSLTLFFQTAPGAFDQVTDLTAGFLDVVLRVLAVDMDGDGDLDLVAAARNRISGNPNLSIIYQSNPGVFDLRDRIVLSTPGTLSTLAVADVDGDGHMDIVGSSSGSDFLILFFQTESGVFERTRLEAGFLESARQPVPADIDGDGDLDLVVPASNRITGTANLVVLFQSSPRTFNLGDRTVLRLPAANPSNSVVASDLDGDGDLDLAAVLFTSGQPSSIALFRQVNPGVFDPRPTLLEAGPGFIGQILVADLDQDGDPDIALTDGANASVTLLFGAD